MLTATQLDNALTSNSAGQAFDMQLMTDKGNYNPARDETGVTVDCIWSAPQNGVTVAGRVLPLPLLMLVIAPVTQYANEGCVKPVAGLGQAACVDSLGAVAVQAGAFDLVISDEVSKTPDLALEKQLATDALPALPAGG